MKRNGISVRRFAKGLGGLLVVAVGFAWWAWPETPNLTGRLVDYHKIYDVFWDVACDTAVDGTDQGCYIQYVDVYRPRPEFAAAMVEVVVHQGGDGAPDPHIRFDIEPELSFREARIQVATTSGEMPIDVASCATNTCLITGDRARSILALWRDGTSIELEISEGRDKPALLSWPLGQINTILDDFESQRAERGLP